MSDFVLLDDDLANFIPAFGPAIVVVQPGKLKASGPDNFNGRRLCVDGDEKSVKVPGCAYTAGSYVIPGTGTLKIKSLSGNQKANKIKSGGKYVLLKGSLFNAVFEVQSPAQQPTSTGPIPDSTSSYSGKGLFTTKNTAFKAT